MPSNPSLYRYINFIGGNVLDAQNVISVETQELLRTKQGLGSLYKDGALLNAHFRVSGTSLFLECTDTNFPVWVFIRGTFEVLVIAGGSAALPTIPSLASGIYPFYLNWSLDIKTSVDDATLIDGTTGEPTVEMGQLSMTLAWVDESSTPLDAGTQFDKNTIPLKLAVFNVDGSSVITVQYINGVSTVALANTRQAGLANLTDDSGIAVGTTDPRLSNSRSPAPGSIFDVSVAPLIETNPTIPPQYDPIALGQGGIFSEHIIYTTLKEKLTDFLDSINAAINSAIASLAAHIGQPLGSVATHPFPTANQVGAAPASHVGQPLGLSTSHPALVNDDHNGFTVSRNPAVSASDSDYGYTLTDGVGLIAGMSHKGDIFGKLANAFDAEGGNGTGGSAAFRGLLGSMTSIAAVLAEHVNYTTHGNNNPHNLNSGDIGAASTSYVDTSIASVLAAAEAYTDTHSSIAVRVVATNGTGFTNWSGGVPYGHFPSNTLNFPTQNTLTNVIVTLGGHFELAFGFGTYWTSNAVDLPEPSGWDASQFFVQPSLRLMYSMTNNASAAYFDVYYNPGDHTVHSFYLDDSSSTGGGHGEEGWINVMTLAWRFI